MAQATAEVVDFGEFRRRRDAARRTAVPATAMAQPVPLVMWCPVPMWFIVPYWQVM